MKKLVSIAIGCATLAALSGCAMAQAPVNGFWYSDVQHGTEGTTAPRPTKMGEACATSILGIVATGDASVNTARTKGGINQISSVDHTSNSILGIYAKYCTVVRGN